MAVVQRVRRNVVAVLAAADEEGSGIDTPLFNGTGKWSAYKKMNVPLNRESLILMMQLLGIIFLYFLSLSLLLHIESCNAAPDTGPCFGTHHRYFYNSSSMSCELFKYGGCLGNQNNFETERECLQRCRTEGEEWSQRKKTHNT